MTNAVSSDQRALKIEEASLPVIDLGGLFSETPGARKDVARALGDAARTSGFFYITNHGIPPALIDGIFAASRSFHEKPRRFKM